MTDSTIHSKENLLLTKSSLSCMLHNTVKVWFLRIISMPCKVTAIPRKNLARSFSKPTASAKEKTMSNSSNRSFWSRNTNNVIALIVVTFGLVACGGGGSTPVVDTPVKALSASISAVGLLAGGLNAVSPVAVDTVLGMAYDVVGDPGTVSATSTVLSCNDISLGLSIKVDQTTKTVGFGNAVPLPYSASCTVSGILVGTAALPTNGHPTAPFSYTFTTVADPKLHYGEKVYSIWGTINMPYLLNADGTKTKVINATSHKHPELFSDFGGCARGDKIANGYRLVRCKDSSTLANFDAVINPATNTMTDYGGDTSKVTWVYVDTANFATNHGNEALGSTGLYYVQGDSTSVVYFQATGSMTSTVYNNGTFAADGNVKALWVEAAQ